jgi:hypothetical protein
MSLIRGVLFFFALLYGIIAVHYVTYERLEKKRCLNEVASSLKTVDLSVSYTYESYRKFVYVR